MNEQNAQDLAKIEKDIEAAQLAIQRLDALVRLEKNKDFKLLIGEGFLEKHAIRQIHLKGSPGMQAENIQKMIDQQLTSVAGLKQFFINIFQEGQNAKISVESDEATREALLAEGLE